MKVLHVLYSGLGGHGNVFFSMVDADRQRQFSYAAVFNGIEPVREEYITRCAERNIPWTYIKKEQGLHPGFYRQLWRSIRQNKPDIIFLHGGIAVLPARLVKLFSKNTRQILVRETQANHLKNRGDKIRLWLSLCFADKVVFLTEAYKEQVKQQYRRCFRPAKTVVIPNGIDLDVFKPAPAAGGGKTVLGMLSRIVSLKDHETLLRAVALLKNRRNCPPFELQIAGEGAEEQRLKLLTIELGLQQEVIFTGVINESGIPAFMQRLDIYVHASLGETMSTSLMQAMACAKPVIASDVPGINNMLQQNKTGLLVPVRQPDTLAVAIEQLVQDRALQLALGQAARQFAADNFSNLIMFERYKKIMQA